MTSFQYHLNVPRRSKVHYRVVRLYVHFLPSVSVCRLCKTGTTTIIRDISLHNALEFQQSSLQRFYYTKASLPWYVTYCNSVGFTNKGLKKTQLQETKCEILLKKVRKINSSWVTPRPLRDNVKHSDMLHIYGKMCKHLVAIWFAQELHRWLQLYNENLKFQRIVLFF